MELLEKYIQLREEAAEGQDRLASLHFYVTNLWDGITYISFSSNDHTGSHFGLLYLKLHYLLTQLSLAPSSYKNAHDPETHIPNKLFKMWNDKRER